MDRERSSNAQALVVRECAGVGVVEAAVSRVERLGPVWVEGRAAGAVSCARSGAACDCPCGRARWLVVEGEADPDC